MIDQCDYQQYYKISEGFIILYPTVPYGYVEANAEGGCCTSDEVFAERCHCSGLEDWRVDFT